MKTRENQVQTIDIKEVKQEVVDKMEQYKQEFIEFMVESDVLKFGEFTLKSGRKSPFFMNAGAYVTGSQLMRLGEYYAKAIHEKYGDDFDVLFGPAYKGIPISVVTAVAFSKLYGKEVRYCSDRKEEKDHGADKGSFLGSSLKDGDRVVMIEDVTTSGFKNGYAHIGMIMFLRGLFTGLWMLLFIIPGIVKSYEYMMIPYLLAEHPEMTRQEAFAESKQMMDGNKWDAFVLDLSFIGWTLLGVCTFGILLVFYVEPYIYLTRAELYHALKNNNKSVEF